MAATQTSNAYMQRALQLARQGLGRTQPNPTVGCVIVKDGRIVGEGHTQPGGRPHAEVVALKQAGEAARGAAMYVTLEPCSHYGRTPPCVDAVLEAGISEVHIAVLDPNPQVNGAGLRKLQERGVRVVLGEEEAPARRLNEAFFHYIRTGQPFVHAKLALSLDGKIATRTGQSQWITGPEARMLGHGWRDTHNAIMVGVGTVLADNPLLTTRLPEREDVSHPLRVVVDSRARTPTTARMLGPDAPGCTLIAATERAPAAVRDALAVRGAEVVVLPATPEGQVDLRALLTELGRREVLSVLLEGGGALLGSFLAAGLVNRVSAFVAPVLIGGKLAPGAVGDPGAASLAEAWRLQEVEVERVGDDVLITGRLE